MKRKLLLTCLAVFSALTLYATTYNGTCGENLTWIYDSETQTLTISGQGDMQDYQQMHGYTAPWDHGYYPQFDVKTIIVESGVTSIGGYAFSGCRNLTSITLPNTITKIGHDAFYSCDELSSIDVPASVTEIGSYAFQYCDALTSFTIPDGVTDLYGTFSGCSSLTSISIPESVLNISDGTFRTCSSLESITIPNSVTRIGNEAFRNCVVLSSVIVGNSVTTIGSNAFCNCPKLTSISIPNSVTSIGNSAFDGVLNVTYTGTATGSPWGAKLLNTYVEGDFAYANNTKQYLLGCSRGATGDIIIPNTVTRIGDMAFSYCANITSVTMPNSVTKIGDGTFSRSGCTSVLLSESLTNISSQTFYECRALAYVSIPNSVTSIGSSAFSGCSGLTSISIPNNVTSIGSSAFSGCSGLTSITIPNNVTSIGDDAFNSCSGLASITIPNSVIGIGAQAFENCSNLTSITIPNSVTWIGSSAFDNCINLTSIYMEHTTPPSMYYRIYNGYNATLYVPCGSASAYAAAQYWDDFADIEEVGCEPSPEELSYTREDLTVGRFGTICLPKRVENEDITGARFYSIAFALKNTNDEITSILLDEETSGLQAGKPYLFRATATTMTLDYSGFAVEDPIAANGLVGNLNAEDMDVPQGKYILSNNQLRKLAGGNATVAQNRAYIDLDNVHAYTVFPVEPSPAQVQLRVADSNPVATDIKSVEVRGANKVLRNGKLLILRDNKTFDLTGRQIL